jgi:hypothetical protein
MTFRRFLIPPMLHPFKKKARNFQKLLDMGFSGTMLRVSKRSTP